ncbi:hypothetical protein PCASD_16822 [Puccinia coronata f. sp. avenae]|uniref:Uncharacterized protein n=1 Tax=Puccinia coronata f. sp. avenae TaxID=200324 RepID=A0A2N5U4P0_9BASI|nr:hypothetical protein PCASD_16822 [Puccinia coronata f. sp. avenae]
MYSTTGGLHVAAGRDPEATRGRVTLGDRVAHTLECGHNDPISSPEPTGTSPIDYTPSGSHHWFLNAAQVVLPQPASQPAFRYACRPLQPEDPSRTPAAAHTY